MHQETLSQAISERFPVLKNRPSTSLVSPHLRYPIATSGTPMQWHPLTDFYHRTANQIYPCHNGNRTNDPLFLSEYLAHIMLHKRANNIKNTKQKKTTLIYFITYTILHDVIRIGSPGKLTNQIKWQPLTRLSLLFLN